MNPKETIQIQRQVEELISKGLVRESRSPCVVPAFLVPKKNGSMRMCVDSRAIKRSLSNICTLSHGLRTYWISFKAHVCSLRWIWGVDTTKSAFKTKGGLYEWLVMPFRLSNAPSTFMRLMNKVFRPYVGHFVVVYPMIFWPIARMKRTTKAT